MEQITGLDLLINAAPSLPSFRYLLVTLSGLIGLFMVSSGIAEWSSVARQGQEPTKTVVSKVVVGALLFALQPIAESLSTTLLGDYFGPDILEAYTGVSGTQSEQARQVVMLYIETLGWFWIFRGVFNFRKAGQPQGQGAPSPVLVSFGYWTVGVISLNFWVFVNVVSITFGGDPVGTEYFK